MINLVLEILKFWKENRFSILKPQISFPFSLYLFYNYLELEVTEIKF